MRHISDSGEGSLGRLRVSEDPDDYDEDEVAAAA